MLTHINEDYLNKVFTPGQVLSEDYVNCNFYLSTLNGVRLVGKFTNCKFISAELQHAMLMGADFTKCSFIGAKFKNTEIRGCTFDECDFAGASMFQVGAISTSKFRANCMGMLGMATDLAIKLIGSKQIWSICPRDVARGLGGFCTPAQSVSLKEYIPLDRGRTMAPTRTERWGPAHDSWDELIDADSGMVDPVFLPEVAHYRSSPSQIPRSKKPTGSTRTLYEEQDYYGGSGYTMNGHYNYQTHVHNIEYKYGYMDNAILECSDIEELKKCLT
jgi:hypothetical protein